MDNSLILSILQSHPPLSLSTSFYYYYFSTKFCNFSAGRLKRIAWWCRVMQLQLPRAYYLNVGRLIQLTILLFYPEIKHWYQSPSPLSQPMSLIICKCQWINTITMPNTQHTHLYKPFFHFNKLLQQIVLMQFLSNKFGWEIVFFCR